MGPRHEILMIGPHTQPLVDIAEFLDDSLYSVVFTQARHPIDYLLTHRSWRPAGAIVRLAGDESKEDFLPLFQAFSETGFIFLRGREIPAPEIDEAIEGYGGQVIDPALKSPQQIVEQLAAVMFHRKLR
jgi:hypothetical protein